MRVRTALASAAMLAAPMLAGAQPVTGLYVGGGAGGNFLQDYRLDQTYVSIPPGLRGLPAVNSTNRSQQRFDAGAVALGSVGYGLGNGLRIEAEGDYRYNSDSSRRSSSGSESEQKFGILGNVLYDFDLGLPYLYPYVGAGGGFMWADRGFALGRTSSFAYQGIAGVAAPLPWVHGLSATLEYRFLGLGGISRRENVPNFVGLGPTTVTAKYNEDYNHSILIGLRYAFNTPQPPPPPVAAPPVQPALARTYLVFFDWDRADLTDRARQIVAEAARASTRVQYTRIEVQGNADRSGTPAYNQGLSLRRAQTVAAELVRNGVPRTAIDIQAFGDTRPLVPTAPGVREPQNRRVAIILR